MSDLFDLLKSEGPVKKKPGAPLKSPWKTPSKDNDKKSSKYDSEHKSKSESEHKSKNDSGFKSKYDSGHKSKSESEHKSKNDSGFKSKYDSEHKSKSATSGDKRRESLPTSTTGSVAKKSKSDKSRSLSPPKEGVKSLKVKLERKKLESFHSHPLDEHANNIKVKHDKDGNNIKSKHDKDGNNVKSKHDKDGNNIKSKHDKSSKDGNNIKSKHDKSSEGGNNIKSKHDKHKVSGSSNKEKHDKHKDSGSSLKEKYDKLKDIGSSFKDKHDKIKDTGSSLKDKHDKNRDVNIPQKMTPTKAQQKLFEPPPVVVQKKTKAQVLREYNIKSCKVRIHRDNLKKLLRDFQNKKNAKNLLKKSAPSSGSPPSKKEKFSSPSISKPKLNFFIKLNTSPPSKLDKKLKNLARSSTAVAHHNKIQNSKTASEITTPTKFSRSELVRSFGQRYFNAQVKIERCKHPLMLIFESNDRARRLQSKRNKSKNLSVSFREQVEVFGGSSDSDDSYDENFCAAPNRNARKNASHKKGAPPATPVVMPARLKKVENGKVVDDIELDPSLFVDPKALFASTPYSPGRKKRDHKSYSPLKDECTPSPRKEQLKLANEKIPPSGLKRLNIDMEDDDDDDCEYIVPIEMPQRRISRTSSNASRDGTSYPLPNTTANFTGGTRNIMNNVLNDPGYNRNNQLEIISDDSFQSANDVRGQNNADKLPTLSSLQNFPRLEFNNALGGRENGDLNDGDANVDFNTSRKQTNAMHDLSMNLFMEDSQSNENDNHSKSFVDTLINETIDKLTKDIDDEGASDEHFTN